MSAEKYLKRRTMKKALQAAEVGALVMVIGKMKHRPGFRINFNYHLN